MISKNFVSQYELLFHYEFINDEKFPEYKKEALIKDYDTYYIMDDFTIYQNKEHPLSVINQSDYINNRGTFSKILYNLPLNKVEAYIEFHFNKFKGDKKAFLEQAYYEFKASKLMQGDKILPDKIQKTIMLEWLSNKKTMVLRKQLQEKNEFLRKAYEVANQHTPSSPLSVSINPIELGNSIDFDKSTTTRIMHELVNDGYVTSGLGMGFLMVTREGLNYLLELENPIMQNSSAINLNAGNNSNINFINNSPGAKIDNRSQVINKIKNIIDTVHSDNSVDNSIKQQAIATLNELIKEVEDGETTGNTINKLLTIGANIASIGSAIISLFQILSPIK